MIPSAIAQWRPQAAAYRDAIECDVILAVIWQETFPMGDSWSYRYESGYQYFYDAKSSKPLFDKSLSVQANRNKAAIVLGSTEFAQQSASWGLMQVMGAVAREMGMKGWITRLCDPHEGVRLGCLYLNRLLKGTGDLREALVRYNGASIYADHVFEKLKQIRSS